jgi:ketol-acid reductoisomerase
MAVIYRDEEAVLSLVQNCKVATLCYGAQWHAHALNRRDSVKVKVGPRNGSSSRRNAEAGSLSGSSVAD